MNDQYIITLPEIDTTITVPPPMESIKVGIPDEHGEYRWIDCTERDEWIKAYTLHCLGNKDIQIRIDLPFPDLM